MISCHRNRISPLRREEPGWVDRYAMRDHGDDGGRDACRLIGGESNPRVALRTQRDAGYSGIQENCPEFETRHSLGRYQPAPAGVKCRASSEA